MSIAWERALAKSLADLAAVLGIPCQTGWTQVEVTGVCEDTRRLIPGNLFVAISGHHQDGRAYVNHAMEKGAVAVLAEQALSAPVPVFAVPHARVALACLAAAFYDDPTRELFTVGVTGTNGKTTVCHWTADILGRHCTRLLSTVRNPALGMPGLTTPPSPMIQSLAREAVSESMTTLILEASSAGIEQERVSAIDFDACVFTNLSIEHVRHHNGLAAYRSAKLKLFEALKPEAWAIVNADDPIADAVAAVTAAQVLRYGCSVEADVRASDIQLGSRSSRFVVHIAGANERMSVCLPTPGRHNVFNALAAISVGVVAAVSLPDIVERLAKAGSLPGRNDFFCREDGVAAVVDFAHNAAALKALLATLRPSYSRLIVVFGCPGDGEREKRTAMGKVSAQWADRIVLTSDNPKHEDVRAIAEEIRAGMTGAPIPVSFVMDRARAIGSAVEQAKPGDLVVIAGKGHEAEQLIEDDRLPYSDGDVLETLGFVADVGTTDG